MISYSLHFGSKKHAISNKIKLSSVSKHNMREYEDKFSCPSAIDLELSQHNEILRGSNNLYKDVEKFYRDTFDESRLEYNAKQTRDDRKIFDYFQKISDDKQKNIAVECIIQVADKEYWERIELEDRKKMTEVFEKQIQYLEKNLENFKIVNAVVHYDESSPHLQIVGVPISTKNKRGMEVQVSKNSVFSQEIMRKLQAEMREVAIQDFNRVYQKKEVLKGKEKGRNYDYNIDEIKLVKEHEKVLDRDRKEVLEILSKKKKSFGVFGKEEVKLDEKEVDKILQFISTKSAIFESRKSLDILKEKNKDLEQRNIDVAGEIEQKKNELLRKNNEIEVLKIQKTELEKNISEKKAVAEDELSKFYNARKYNLERELESKIEILNSSYDKKRLELESNLNLKKYRLERELELERKNLKDKIITEIREEVKQELVVNNAELQTLKQHLEELEKIKKSLEKECKKLEKLKELEQMEEEKLALEKIIFNKKNEVSNLDSLKDKVHKEIEDLKKEKLEIKTREQNLIRKEYQLKEEKLSLKNREDSIKIEKDKIENQKLELTKELEKYHQIKEELSSSRREINQLDDKKRAVSNEIKNIENQLEDRKELLQEIENYRELMRISAKSSDEFSQKLREKFIEISIENKMSAGIEESINSLKEKNSLEERIILNAKIEMYEKKYKDNSSEEIQEKIKNFQSYKENFKFDYEEVREILKNFISKRNNLILENKNLKVVLEQSANTKSASELKQIDRTIKSNNNKIRVLNQAKLIVSKATKLDKLPPRTAGAVSGYTEKNNRTLEENLNNTSKLSVLASNCVIEIYDDEIDIVEKEKRKIQARARGYER